MARVKQEHPSVVKQIEVKELKNRKASLEAEMYLGTRNGQKAGVLELKELALDPQHGLPHYYLVVDDASVVDHYVEDHFEPAWNDLTAQEKDVFAPPAEAAPATPPAARK